MIKAILFDVIGTTVEERDPSLINNCFVQAFGENGFDISLGEIKRIRGMSKDEAVRKIIVERGSSPSLTQSVLRSFHAAVAASVHNFSERPEFPALVDFLRTRKMIIGVGTGLSSQLFELIFNFLDWKRYQFDFVGIADEVGAGRPDPKMLLLMMERFGLKTSEVIKVGDTVADIQEGKNAGVKTAVLLAGTQDEATLRGANPDFVLTSLSQLHSILEP